MRINLKQNLFKFLSFVQFTFGILGFWSELIWKARGDIWYASLAADLPSRCLHVKIYYSTSENTSKYFYY